MRTIGIRVSPNEVTFVIYDTDENEIINVEKEGYGVVPDIRRFALGRAHALRHRFKVRAGRAALSGPDPRDHEPFS